MNEEQKKIKLKEMEARAEALNRALADPELNRIGNESKRKPFADEYANLWKEYQALLSLEELGTVGFYPVLVYQNEKMGLSLLSKDKGKHWEVIDTVDLGIGHHGSTMHVESENLVPKRLTDTVPNQRFHTETKRVINIDLVAEQPKPEAPKTRPVVLVKLPGLTTCLSCAQKYMENEKECPICHKTREQSLQELNKKEHKGFFHGIVEGFKNE